MIRKPKPWWLTVILIVGFVLAGFLALTCEAAEWGVAALLFRWVQGAIVWEVIRDQT